MPFSIVRNDITHMQVDAIVNTANPKPVIGYGVDAGIHQAAGPKLLEAREKIGVIPVGDAAITPGFDLPAKYVIHAVGPVWRGGLLGEKRLLRRCYTQALALAKSRGCVSVAFPLMSAGNHGFPKEIAMNIAMGAIQEFLLENDMTVYLVVFSKSAVSLSEKLFQRISSFIDENYVLEANLKQYGVSNKCNVREQQQNLILREQTRRRQILEEEADYSAAPRADEMTAPSPLASPSAAPEVPRPAKASAPRMSLLRPRPSLQDLLAETDAGFSETLLKLIDRTGKKDSEIYARANISRQHFNKIKNHPGYKPTKATAIAFAIALELDLEETRDLIGRAGYALTKSSKFDVIIMYFIRERNYNIMDINTALFEFDQSLLGA